MFLYIWITRLTIIICFRLLRERDASGWMTRLTMIISFKLPNDEGNLNPGVGGRIALSPTEDVFIP